MMQNKNILIGITYNEYVPGMKLYFHKDYGPYKEGAVVEIEEMSGYNKETKTFKFPRELYFLTVDGVKIVWNEAPVSCYVERDKTTTFIANMFEYYKRDADEKMNDVRNYEWKKNDYDRYLEDKHETIIEVLLEYEKQRINQETSVD